MSHQKTDHRGVLSFSSVMCVCVCARLLPPFTVSGIFIRNGVEIGKKTRAQCNLGPQSKEKLSCFCWIELGMSALTVISSDQEMYLLLLLTLNPSPIHSKKKSGTIVVFSTFDVILLACASPYGVIFIITTITLAPSLTVTITDRLP